MMPLLKVTEHLIYSHEETETVEAWLDPEKLAAVIQDVNYRYLYKVFADGVIIHVDEGDLKRIIAARGGEIDNDQKPPQVAITTWALISLWAVVNKIDELSVLPEPNFASAVGKEIDKARAIMASWKSSDFQVPQNPTQYTPDALGGLGAHPDREIEPPDDDIPF